MAALSLHSFVQQPPVRNENWNHFSTEDLFSNIFSLKFIKLENDIYRWI